MADFLNLLGSAFGATPPSYMEGLLGQQAVEDLRKQSIGTGIANALIGYMAMPKNKGYGSALPYIGSALMAGQQGAKGVYSDALADYQTQAKIAEMQRKVAQENERNAWLKKYASKLPADLQSAVRAFPELGQKIAESDFIPKERKTATVGNVVVDIETGKPIYAGEKERKTTNIDAVDKILVVDSLTGQTIREIPKGLAPQAPKEPKALYGSAPVKTDQGYVYMPTPEGISQNLKPIDATTGKPITYNLTPESGKKTDSQLLASGYLNRMNSASQIMNSPVNVNGQTMTLEQAAGSDFADSPWFTSNLRKQYKQAQEDWVRAKLRKESGAVIGEQEMADEIKTYFPTWQDDPDTIAQKAYARKVAESSMGIAAGEKEQNVKPFRKSFNINKQSISATLGSDNNYYYIDKKTGKTFKVEE